MNRTKEGMLAAVPEGVAAAAARPAVTAVTEAYLGGGFGGGGVDRNVRIGDVVRAALKAGMSARDVAMGTILGVFRTLPAGGSACADIRGAAAAVLSATTYYGGQVQPAIDGILAAVVLGAEHRGDDGGEAISSATYGIMEAVDYDLPVASREV